ncbi:MAG: type IV toxin-antitoxin system AbiEi family antitoxin domain-containing protein [Thermoleophilaceae bacterium]
MHDAPDHDALYRQAESQAGYFTARQAGEAGMDRRTLSHHARPGGRFERVARGLYRIRLFPSDPHEHIVAAWLGLGTPEAVVSHESALELFDLSDVIADQVHISIPREKRRRHTRPGVRVHTTTRPLTGQDARRANGVPVTSPERTIADVLEAGGQPEQLELAVSQALDRGLTTPARLRRAAADRGTSVRYQIARFTSAIAS